ncbi:MAG: hypothetical protein IJY89_04580 [Clostridia bacterium]|nr:hypothetical protein [Clostridia bacterium]MBQ8911826.1 hypothetical protein [Clostridia bacterium]
MKKAFCLLFALCLCLTSCGMPGKEEIRELVLENRELLESCAEKGDFAEAAFLVGSISESEKYVDFSCGGKGMGGETAYCGFFYIPSDDPLDFFGKLTPSGEGYLWVEWEHGEGDNTVYLEKIFDCFYYYELTY